MVAMPAQANASELAAMNASKTYLPDVPPRQIWLATLPITRPLSQLAFLPRAVLHGRPVPLLPLHGRRSEHTHTQIKSTNKIYLIFLCAHTHTHTVADENDEGGGRRG